MIWTNYTYHTLALFRTIFSLLRLHLGASMSYSQASPKAVRIILAATFLTAVTAIGIASVLAQNLEPNVNPRQPIRVTRVPTGDGIQNAIDALGNLGGIVQLPCTTVPLRRTITIRHTIILQGCGTTIGSPLNQVFNGFDLSTQLPGTRLLWVGGPGIAIDVGPNARDADARGTVLRDFNLENQGDGTIGIRINTQEPRMINVFVMSLGDVTPGKPFSTAGVVVADFPDGMVNDFLCRDCYVRFQEDGIQLLNVSEATIDHSRILENRRNNIVLGDSDHIANNIQIVNGTNFSSARVSAGAGIKINRVENIVNVQDGYCENDEGTLCIDATDITGGNLDQLNIRDTYFAKGFSSPEHAIGVNAPTANVTITGNVFAGDTSAAVLNEAAGRIFVQSNLLLAGTPALLSSTTNATQ